MSIETMHIKTSTWLALIIVASLLGTVPGTALAGVAVCTVPDDGTGTASLPPNGCDYSNPPTSMFNIINGLPAGTTIEIQGTISNFLCGAAPKGGPPHCGTPGGALGGETEVFLADLQMVMTGTNALAGFNRTITMSIQNETHSGPRVLSTSPQQFARDYVQLQGEVFGDPDFAELRMRAGTSFGLPSPGQTTLTDFGGSTWLVDSFFDIEYQIEFVGAPGGALDGLSGTTQLTTRIATPAVVFPQVTVNKLALPPRLVAPGGMANFAVDVVNDGADSFTLQSLVDDVHGDLNGQGSCSVPQVIAGSSTYSCGFNAMLTGVAGGQETDTVVAQVISDSGLTGTDLDSATIRFTAAPFDFGDAMEPPYFTLMPMGPFHDIVSAPGGMAFLGNQVDGEPNGIVSPGADGDDLAELNDEDGVVLGTLIEGSPSNVFIIVNNDGPTAPPGCFVNLWIDFNGDGVFLPAPDPEHVIVNAMIPPGPAVPFPFITPGPAIPVPIVARARCSSAPGLDPFGPAPDGEVEDHFTMVLPMGATPPPPSITVTKTVSPTNVDETGGPVTYTVTVSNNGPNAVLIDGMTDDLLGPLDAIPGGNCPPGGTQSIGPFPQQFSCSFPATVAGNAGDTVTNQVDVFAFDGDFQPAGASDTATVTIDDVAPTANVSKSANPTNVDEPGGTVDFTVTVTNTSTVESLTLTALNDDVHGNLNGQGNCSLPQTLAIGSFVPPRKGVVAVSDQYQCTFSATVNGNAGDTETDTVTATLNDDDGNTIMPTAMATVSVDDVQPTVSVTKSPNPDNLDEPGGNVDYTVTVTNTSVESVTLTALNDDVFGDITAPGDTTCSVPQSIAVGANYQCSFLGGINRSALDGSHQNTVTATAGDDDGNSVMANAMASVTINDVAPTISVIKSANPTAVTTPGGAVVFTVVVQNTGTAESVDLNSLVDDLRGDLTIFAGSTCTLPQTIAAGGNYQCQFGDNVAGNEGDSETDTVTASASDDEGNMTMAMGSVTVFVSDPKDFGDAPAPYPTTLADNGARHVPGANYLGSVPPDSEVDGQPDPGAAGDDMNTTDDEDGVIVGTLEAGSQDSFSVSTTGSCVINAWIDFNANGSWADAGEQIATDAVVVGDGALNFSVPATSVPGLTYARVRCSPVPGLGFTGLAVDGEVEDYQLTIDPDTTPPGISTVSATPHGTLFPCDEVRVPITDLAILLNEPLDNAGGNLESVSKYTLRGTGADGAFDSAVCTPLTPDDRALPISMAAYDDPSRTITLSLDHGQIVEEAFRLELCGQFQDLAGNQLPGAPNTKGVSVSFDLPHPFRIETVNPVPGAQFDCDLSPWSFPSGPGQFVAFSSLDSQGSGVSGSILLQADGGAMKGIGAEVFANQCLDLPGDNRSLVRYRYRLAANQPVNTRLTCDFFDQAGCAGAFLGSLTDDALLTDTTGQWLERLFEMNTPIGTQSADCGLYLQDEATGSGFDFNWDAILIDLELFGDGFEGAPAP